MIPYGSEGIAHLATRMTEELLPKAADSYVANDIKQLCTLIAMVGEDYDRAADVLVTEDAEITAFLREAAPLLAPTGLRERIEAAIAGRAGSLRIRDLTARSEVLMRLLIDVHAEVEDAASAGASWAAPLESQIWALLDAHVRRRAYSVAR